MRNTTDLEKRFTLVWTAADKQKCIRMGSYYSRDFALFAKNTELRYMLRECANQDERDRLNAGTWSIV